MYIAVKLLCSQTWLSGLYFIKRGFNYTFSGISTCDAYLFYMCSSSVSQLKLAIMVSV